MLQDLIKFSIPKLRLDLTVLLEGQLENPFPNPSAVNWVLVLNVMVQHPGGTLEVEDIANVMLDGEHRTRPIRWIQDGGAGNLVRQLNGSADITDLGAVSRLWANSFISIRVAGEVSLLLPRWRHHFLDRSQSHCVVRLLWDQTTNNAFRDWNQTVRRRGSRDQNWTPASCHPSVKRQFLVHQRYRDHHWHREDVANPMQVDIFSGSFLFDRDLRVNANG